MSQEKKLFKTSLAVYLVLLNDKKQVLLMRRKNTGYYDGYYSLVAGKIDGNETVLDAAIRETKEEVGLSLIKDNLKVSCVMHRKTEIREIIDFFIIVKNWQGDPLNMEPHKCEEIRFFDLNNLPHDIVEYVKTGIECALNNIAYVEYGWN